MSPSNRCCVFVTAFVFAAFTLWLPLGAGEKTGGLEVVAKLKGHSEPVASVAFSPDGKYLVTGSHDHTIKLWEVAGNKEIKTYDGAAGHQKMVLAVAVSLDGQLIASGSVDNTLKVWDVPIGSPVRSFKTADANRALSLSPDGTKLAVAGKDGSIKILSAADFKELFKLDGHQGLVTGVAFSANAQVLASTGIDRTVRFWNATNGQPIAVAGAHGRSANAVAVSPNNVAYTTGDDGQLRFWQIPPAPTSKVLPGHAGAIRALALSADGNQLVTGGDDKTARLFPTAGPKELRAFTGPNAPVISVALHPANTQIAAGTQDERVFLWNAADGKPLANFLANAGPVSAVQFHPQGTQLATAGGDGLVKFWALPPVPSRSVPHPEAVTLAIASADGKKLYTGSADKIVRIWDVTKPAIERQFTGHTGPITAVAVSANGQQLLSGSADASIRAWNLATGKESDIVVGHAAPVTSLALHPAGTQLLSSSEDGTVKLWQLPFVAPKAMPHPDQVTGVVLTPDGTKAFTGGGDKIVRLWNLASGAKERDYAGGPTLPISALAVSPNGQLLAVTSPDKTLTLWNVGDGKVLQKIALPSLALAVALSPDNQTVVVGSAEGAIKLIKVADGKESKALAGHKGAVTALAFTPKGDALYSASADKAVQMWSWPDGAPKTKLEHSVPVTSMVLSKDGARLAVVGDKAVAVWSLPDGKPLAAWPTLAETRGLAFSHDATRLALAGVDKQARVCEIDGKLLESFAHDGPVQGVAFADAKRLVTASADKMARVWTSALLWGKAHAGPVRQAFFTPKADQIITGSDDKTIKFWNAADGKEIKALSQPEGPVLHLSLSADASKLASAGADKVVNVWNLVPAKPGAPEETKPAQTLPIAGSIQAVSLSPNGQRVAVALAEGPNSLTRVYDLALGRDVQVLAEHTAAVKSLAWLADNRTLLSASADKTARLLDVGVVSAFAAHTVGPTFIQYSNVPTQLLTAGADKTVKLWDLTKAAVLKNYGPTQEPIKAIAFSRDFTQVAAATGKLVKVWNAADAKELATLTHPADVLSLSFNSDKTRIVTGAADKETRIWDALTGKELQFFPQEDAVAAVLYAPNNATVLSAAGNLAKIDAPSIVRALPADAGPVSALVLMANNTHVLTGGADKLVKMWNIGTGVIDKTFAGATGTVNAVAARKDSLLVAVGGADQTVRVYQLADGKEIGAVKVGGEIRALTFTPNGAALIASLADKTMHAWSVVFQPGQPLPAEFLKPVQSYNAAEPVLDITIAADSATMFTAGLDKAVHVWKLASAIPTRNFPHPNHVDAVAFQPNGTLLASGGHDGKLRFFDLVKNAQVKEVNAHIVANNASTIYTIAFSPDGKQIVTSSLDNSLKLWDVASGNLVKEFKPYKVKEFEKGHQEPVYSAAISPDGKLLASGSGGLERVIKIWNLADGSVLRDLPNPTIKTPPMQPPSSHPGWIYRLQFTKDGKNLISVGDAPLNKGFLAVWNPVGGQMVYGESFPMGTFYGMALAPDEKSLAIAAGNRGRPNPEFNTIYMVKLPMLK